MKRTSTSLAVAFLIGCATLAWADQEPNSLGIYFDPTASQNETWCETPCTVTGYLILTAPTMASIEAWWLGIDFQTTVHSCALAGGGVNRSSLADPFVTFLYVQLDTPLPCSSTTVLATLTIGMDAVNSQSCLYITNYVGNYGAPDDPGALSGGETIRFRPSVGIPNYPIIFPACVAAINQNAPVREEGATWGGVKALYD